MSDTSRDQRRPAEPPPLSALKTDQAGPSAPELRAVRARAHPNCVVCSSANPAGLGITYTLMEDGSVEADFDSAGCFEGYPDVLHGGVVAAILDGAMTNCLFARGVVAVTAELRVRFRHQVDADAPSRVRAWVEDANGALHVTRAELLQNGQLKVRAAGKFMARPVLMNGGEPAA